MEMMSFSILVPLPTHETGLLIQDDNSWVPGNAMLATDGPNPPPVQSNKSFIVDSAVASSLRQINHSDRHKPC